MKRSVRPSLVLVVGTLGLAGLGLGHVGEYILLAPDHHERHELLARTGHHYLPSALNAVAYGAILALALVFLTGLGRGLGWITHRRRTLGWSRALPVAQVLAFAALEVGERVAAHSSLGDIGIVLALGLPLQALVGYLAGRLVAEAEKAGERLGERLRSAARRRRRTRSSCPCPTASSRPVPASVGPALPARGPPSVLVPA